MIAMALNGSGIRDTARVLTISPTPVLHALKKSGVTEQCLPASTRLVGSRRGKVLAYVFGRRQDEGFVQLQALLEPFGITRD